MARRKRRRGQRASGPPVLAEAPGKPHNQDGQVCLCSFLRGQKKKNHGLIPEDMAKKSGGALVVRPGDTRYATHYFCRCQVCGGAWTVQEEVDVKECETLYHWTEEDWGEDDIVREAVEEQQNVAELRRRQAERARRPATVALDRMASVALAAVRRQDWPEALKQAKEVLRHRQADTTALFAAGVAQGAQGQLEEARRALEALVEREPGHRDGWYNLGNVHREAGEHEHAVACYRQALEIDRDNHPAFYQLARVLEAAGRKEEAVAAYREAVRTSPNPGGAWGYRGVDFTSEAEHAIARLTRPSSAARPLAARTRNEDDAQAALARNGVPFTTDAFIAAVARGEVETCRLFIEGGMDLEVRDATLRRSPLIWAIDHGHSALARLLLEFGASPGNPDGQGNRALHVAANHGHADIAEALIERGADVNQRGSQRTTPLIYALPHVAVTQLLLQRGADPNQPGDLGLGPLHMAAHAGHAEVLRLLLAAGADPNARNDVGQTPLHTCAAWGPPGGIGAVDVARVLLDHGADPEPKDARGQTPLDIARAEGSPLATYMAARAGGGPVPAPPSGRR